MSPCAHFGQSQLDQNGRESKPRADKSPVACGYLVVLVRSTKFRCHPNLQQRAADLGLADPMLPDAARTITREEGPLALYKGVVPALMMCGQGAVQFSVYEWLKARVPKHDENVS